MNTTFHSSWMADLQRTCPPFSQTCPLKFILVELSAWHGTGEAANECESYSKSYSNLSEDLNPPRGDDGTPFICRRRLASRCCHLKCRHGMNDSSSSASAAQDNISGGSRRTLKPSASLRKLIFQPGGAAGRPGLLWTLNATKIYLRTFRDRHATETPCQATSKRGR